MKTVTLTRREVLSMNAALAGMAQVQLDKEKDKKVDFSKFCYAVSRTRQGIRDEVEAINDANKRDFAKRQLDLAKECAEKDADDKPVPEGGG